MSTVVKEYDVSAFAQERGPRYAASTGWSQRQAVQKLRDAVQSILNTMEVNEGEAFPLPRSNGEVHVLQITKLGASKFKVAVR